MTAAPLHPEETSRLEILRSLGVLDSGSESVYNEIIQYAADALEVPIALISLVDEDRQWFKAKVGTDLKQAKRCDAFCAHAILESDGPLVVADAHADPRFCDNPMVTGPPHIRFYAGVPILGSNQLPLGTLCVIDTKPSHLTELQARLLKLLARNVETLLEMRVVYQSKSRLKRTQAALDTAADAVLWVAPDGRFTYANDVACRRLQYTREELCQLSVSDINPDVDSIEVFKSKFWPNLLKSKFAIYEMRHQRKDGSVFPVEIATHLIEFDDEVFTCSMVRDITDRRLAEQKMAQYAADLTKANAELEQFAYVASHDLKQPLRGISHLAQWTEEDAGESFPEEAKAHLVKLQQRVVRMDQLLDDLLEYSRAGRAEHITETIDVGELVRDEIEMMSVPSDFTIECVGEFPTLWTQRAPLAQVFRNLIGNAIKHRGPDAGEVTISAESSEETSSFSVTDNGIGIAPKFHDKVFGMLETLRSKEEVEGSGIGLALVKKLVESRGATVSLQSSESNGSTFTFTWPSEAKE